MGRGASHSWVLFYQQLDGGVILRPFLKIADSHSGSTRDGDG